MAHYYRKTYRGQYRKSNLEKGLDALAKNWQKRQGRQSIIPAEKYNAISVPFTILIVILLVAVAVSAVIGVRAIDNWNLADPEFAAEALKQPAIRFMFAALIIAMISGMIKNGILNMEASKLYSAWLGGYSFAPIESFKAYRSANRQNDFTGCYVFHNITKNKYYVGQGKSVLTRVNNHLTGHGNGDIYADYKYGDEFEIKMVPIKGSVYASLNEMEKELIQQYNAYNKGYNKTKGNRN